MTGRSYKTDDPSEIDARASIEYLNLLDQLEEQRAQMRHGEQVVRDAAAERFENKQRHHRQSRFLARKVEARRQSTSDERK